MPPRTPIPMLPRWLCSSKFPLPHQSHGRTCVGRSVIEFLDTLERNDFEDALSHLQGSLPVIHLLEQEIQEAKAKRQEDFAEFERAVDGLHGHRGRIHLLEVETRLIRDQWKSEMGGPMEDGQTRWDISDPCGQTRMLKEYGYNDDPMTWGPSDFAIRSGLADYQISSTKKARKTIDEVSPRTCRRERSARTLCEKFQNWLRRRKSSSQLGFKLTGWSWKIGGEEVDVSKSREEFIRAVIGLNAHTS